MGRQQQKKLVRISVEVRSSTTRFRVGVQARNIRKALSMVGGRYPHAEARVAFPVEPESFFVREPSAPEEVVGHERTHEVAA
jgi:hypothetical protein